jgi:hypothetical protein
MLTRLIRLGVLVALLSCAMFVAQPAHSAEACSRGRCGLPQLCSDFHWLSHLYGQDNGHSATFSLVVGQVITITATPYKAGDIDTLRLTNFSDQDYAPPLSAPGTLT